METTRGVYYVNIYIYRRTRNNGIYSGSGERTYSALKDLEPLLLALEVQQRLVDRGSVSGRKDNGQSFIRVRQAVNREGTRQ